MRLAHGWFQFVRPLVQAIRPHVTGLPSYQLAKKGKVGSRWAGRVCRQVGRERSGVVECKGSRMAVWYYRQVTIIVLQHNSRRYRRTILPV